MRRTIRLGIGAIGAALVVLVPAAPAQALYGSGVYACTSPGLSNFGYSSTHQAFVGACIVDDGSYIYATASAFNDGSTATYHVTAQLRRASDNLLIATQGCTETIPAGETFYCTKAWPWSSTVVRTTAVVTRTPLVTQAIVHSPNYTP